MLQAALAHHQAGRYGEAEALYRKILEAEPGNSDALHLLGVALHQLGRNDEAIGFIGKAIATDGSRPEFHNNLGEVHRVLGRPAQAEASYHAALALDANFAPAHGNLGHALLAQGRFEDAQRSYGRAAALDPANAGLRVNRAAALHGLGRTREAEQCAREALALQPDLAEAHASLGIALIELGHPEEGERSCRRAIELNANFAEAHGALGKALMGLDRLEEAVQSARRAVALKPGVAENHNLLAATLAGLMRFEQAAQSYRHALALKPDYVEAHVNLGQLYLLQGDYPSGWKEYAWRRKRDDAVAAPAAWGRQWSGAEDLRGKSILLHSEQGLGDCIHFARYAPLVAAKGAKVFLLVPDPLTPFMHGLGEVLAEGAPTPATDFHCSLLSLPEAFGTTLNDVPTRIPYLRADPGEWRAQLGDDRPLVGLCWRGSPQYAGDRHRSARLEVLEPLLAMRGIRFVSLQKELHAHERAPNLVHPGRDFKSTAELVAALDLVISVDTVWAHWAGAIGKPLWLLLSRHSHWCWLTDREDSPWYPTAKLFQQKTAGDWAPVIERVRDELGRRR